MDKGFLIDTNIAIYFLDARIPENGRLYVQSALNSGACRLSIITKMELLGWNFPNAGDVLKAKQFVAALQLFKLPDDIVDKTIEIRKAFPKTKLPDAIIAATAQVQGLTLLSRNTADFSKIEGLKLVNPFDL